MSLLARVIAIIAVALLPPLAIQVHDEIGQRAARQAEIRAQAKEHAQDIARLAAQIVDGAAATLAAAAFADPGPAADAQACAAGLNRLRERLATLAALEWRGPDGRALCAAGAVAAPALVAAHRLADGRELRGTLDPAWLQAQIAAPARAWGMDIGLFSADGASFAHWPDSSAVRRQVAAAPPWALPGGPPGTSEVAGPGGGLDMLGHMSARLGGQDVLICVRISAERLFAAGDAAAARRYLLMGLGFAAAMALAGMLFRGVITRPLLAILDTTERWRAGDTGARVNLPRPRSEFGLIAQAVNALLDAVSAAQTRLRDRLAELDGVYNAAPVGLGFVDHALTYVTVNAALAEINGVDAAAHRGQPVRALLPGGVDRPLESLRRALQGARVHPVEVVGQPAGPGRPARRLLVSFQPAAAPGGVVVGAIMAVQEVTQLRQTEAALQAALQRANAELERRVAQRTAELEAEVRERVATQAQLHQAQKMGVVGQLTGGVAHDFNNLLTAVIGNLELAMRRAQGRPDLLRLLQGAMRSAERGATLTQRMLAFGRRQYLRMQPVAIAALLDGIGDLLARTIGPRIAVRLEAAADLPLAYADPNQIELVILNLVVNARDAMPNGGEIVIAAAAAAPGEGVTPPAALAPGRYIRLSVRDNGAGMDPETLANAFEPFFTTKPVGRGSGLGLSMVQGVAQQSGGLAEIESAVGIGTTVSVWLPCADEAAISAPAAPTAPRDAMAATEPGESAILLAEDDPEVRAYAAACLEEAGYAVERAASGRAALALLQDRAAAPQLLLADLSMPDMSGLDLARAARALAPGLPVLIVTGYNEAPGALGDASLPVLGKPFKAADLIARVAELIGAANPRHAADVLRLSPQDTLA